MTTRNPNKPPPRTTKRTPATHDSGHIPPQSRTHRAPSDHPSTQTKPTDSTPKRWRQALRLTQRSAAQVLDLTLKAWQEIELGARFETGEPVALPRRTELAMRWLLAEAKGHIDPAAYRAWNRMR